MPNETEKRQIEMAAAELIRRSWGGLIASRVRGAVDDIRTKVIEEAWFGQRTTEGLNDFTYTSHQADTASLAELTGHVLDTAREAVASVYGSAPELQAEQQREAARETPDRSRSRDGPEIGD